MKKLNWRYKVAEPRRLEGSKFQSRKVVKLRVYCLRFCLSPDGRGNPFYCLHKCPSTALWVTSNKKIATTAGLASKKKSASRDGFLNCKNILLMHFLQQRSGLMLNLRRTSQFVHRYKYGLLKWCLLNRRRERVRWSMVYPERIPSNR